MFGKVIVASLAVVSGFANAALDAAVAAGMTSIQADAVAILALVFPVVVAVFGLQMAPKLTKRFGRSI